MISAIIPALNAERILPLTFSALIGAVVEGLVREVIVADGGSTDRTRMIAEHSGATLVEGAAGRGAQLAAGAAQARFPWLLFLHAGTFLSPGWEREAEEMIEAVETGRHPPAAAAFRFALDDRGLAPRLIESLEVLRGGVLGLPDGSRGLLVPRTLYDSVGGFRPLPLMEDVDFARRLGRRRIVLLRTHAVTSAARYRREGYALRILRNQVCLALFLARAPMSRIVRIHEAAPSVPHPHRTE